MGETYIYITTTRKNIVKDFMIKSIYISKNVTPLKYIPKKNYLQLLSKTRVLDM